MTLRTRKTLFYISLGVFLIAAGPLLLYTFGYRLSFGSLKLQKTGGLFISTKPTGASIYIDGKFRKETSFISRGYFLQNLRPKTYAIRVEKDGYLPWSKGLVVEPGAVMDAYAMLTPRNPAVSAILQEPLKDFAASPTGKVLLFSWQQGETPAPISFFDPARNSYLSYANQNARRLLENVSEIPGRITWQEDERAAIGSTEDDWIQFIFQDNGTVEAISLYKTGGLRTVFKKKPDYVIAHPSDPERFFVLEGEDLYIFTGSSLSSQPLLQSIAGITVSQNGITLLENQNGFLYRTNLDGKASVPLSLGKFNSIARGDVWEENNRYFIISSENGLWAATPELKEPEHLSSNPVGRAILLGPENAIWWHGRELWIRWFVEESELPIYQNEFKELLVTMDQPIGSVWRYPDEDSHLLVLAGTELFVLELDGRGGRTKTTIYKGKNPRVFVPPDEKIAYILDDGAFLRVSLNEPASS